MVKGVINKNGIIRTLEEIEQFLNNETWPVIDLCIKTFKSKQKIVGLFNIPRLLFPIIDTLSCYYKGNIKDTAFNAIAFLKDYFSRLNPEYERKGAFIYCICRHGLMHQFIPKFISYRRKNIGWEISLNTSGNLSNHLKMCGKTVIIECVQFYDDLLGALGLYKLDIDQGKDGLINKFISVHEKMMEPMNKTGLLERKPYLKQSDFDFLKK